MTTHGGARTKVRQDDRRGGARPGAGAVQKRIVLTPVSARQLRVLAEDADVTPTEMATRLVLEAYTRMLEEAESKALDRIVESCRYILDSFGYDVTSPEGDDRDKVTY